MGVGHIGLIRTLTSPLSEMGATWGFRAKEGQICCGDTLLVGEGEQGPP